MRGVNGAGAQVGAGGVAPRGLFMGTSLQRKLWRVKSWRVWWEYFFCFQFRKFQPVESGTSSVQNVTGRRGSTGQARRATPDGHHPAIQGASRCLNPAPAPGADPRQIEVSGNLPVGSPRLGARWLAAYRVPGTRDRKTDGQPEQSCRVAPMRMHKWFSLRRGSKHSPS